MSNFERIDPGWPRFARLTFPPAVRAGNLLFMSGMTAVDDEGNLIDAGESVAQVQYIYARMGELLRAAGGSPADVVRTTDYNTTTDGYRGTANVRRKVFGDRFPAATGVIVAWLLRSGALIETEALAVLNES